MKKKRISLYTKTLLLSAAMGFLTTLSLQAQALPEIKKHDPSLIGKGTTLEGVKQGLWNYFDEQDHLLESGHYADGKRIGLWTFFDEQQQKSAQIDYDSLYYREFFPNGDVSVQGPLNDTLERSDLWTYYHLEMQPWARGHYRKGKQTGTWKFWYPDGKKNAEVVMEQGITTWWYYNGNIEMTGPVKAGQRSEERR